MGIDELKQVKSSLTASIGRAGLHSLYPDDFEYYACALELLDSSDKTVALLIFPVMPDSISETHASPVTVSKSATGIISQFNNTFTPVDISVNGTFGRKIRLLVGSKQVQATGFSFNMNLGKELVEATVKTGYGVIKMLQQIHAKTYELDEKNLPHRLFWYNYALNKNYMVEILNAAYNQGRENNMMWDYSLTMKGIAPAEAIDHRKGKDKKSIKNILAFDAINKATFKLTKNIKSLSKSINLIEKGGVNISGTKTLPKFF